MFLETNRNQTCASGRRGVSVSLEPCCPLSATQSPQRRKLLSLGPEGSGVVTGGQRRPARDLTAGVCCWPAGRPHGEGLTPPERGGLPPPCPAPCHCARGSTAWRRARRGCPGGDGFQGLSWATQSHPTPSPGIMRALRHQQARGR